MSAKNKYYSFTGRIKGGYNPTGLQQKSTKTTPGSAGTNESPVLAKKRSHLLIKRKKR